MSVLQLPALNIQARAELITNNLPNFEKVFRENIEKLNYALISDDDFAKAKEDIKALKEAEDNLKAVDKAIVDGSLDVKKLRESLALLANEARDLRLAREKEIKKRDAENKAKIIEDALGLIDHHSRENFRQDVVAGTKRKKSFATMAEGANAVANGINNRHKATSAIIDVFVNKHGQTIAPDSSILINSEPDALREKLNDRVKIAEAEAEKRRLAEEVAELKRKEAEAEADRAAIAKRVFDQVKENEAKIKRNEAEALVKTVDTPDVYAPNVGSIPTSRPVAQTPETAQAVAITPSPSPPVGETVREEMSRFRSTVETSFAPVGAARKELKHPENIKAAAEFAADLNVAWTTFKNKTA